MNKKIIEIIKKARQTHVEWAEYFEMTPAAESLPEHVHVGNAKHHRDYIREYDEVIAGIEQLQEENKAITKRAEAAESDWQACEAELAKAKKQLFEVGEAHVILRNLRALYYSSPNMKEEVVESAAKLMIKQAEEGLRIAQARKQEEYIKFLKAENAEAYKKIEKPKNEYHALQKSIVKTLEA